MKRQAIDVEKIFANLISDKGLVSRVNKELSSSLMRKQYNIKQAEDLNRYFTKKIIHVHISPLKDGKEKKQHPAKTI